MDDVIRIAAEYGVLVMIAVVFVYDKLKTSKTIEQMLFELRESAKIQSAAIESMRHGSENQTTGLNIIQNSLATIRTSLEGYDKQFNYLDNNIRDIRTMLKERPCVIELGNTSPH